MAINARPARIYTIGLLVIAFFLLIGGVELLMFGRSLGMDDPTGRCVLSVVGLVELLYVVAIAATLALRAWSPAVGQIATTALNIVLLPAFPFGTAVGIYGLWKVDRPQRTGAT